MKLASLKNSEHNPGHDGRLIIVDKHMEYAIAPEHIPTMQFALDNWQDCEAEMAGLYALLNHQRPDDAFDLDLNQLTAPLPRAYQWFNGNIYPNHTQDLSQIVQDDEVNNAKPHIIEFNAPKLCGPYEPIPLHRFEDMLDISGQLCLVTDNIDEGIEQCMVGDRIKLLMLANYLSYKSPSEKVQKPPCPSFSGIAITPDELGSAWHGQKVSLPLVAHINGVLLGKPRADSDMLFNFAQLIHHVAKKQSLSPGTIISTGTVSNTNIERGSCSLAQKRAIEYAQFNEATTPFLHIGDEVVLEMFSAQGNSIFGPIRQQVIERIKSSSIDAEAKQT